MRPPIADVVTVSVVMGVYDAAPFVGEAVASVLAQTYSAFELIVVDDGSRDDTVRVVERIQDRRVRLIRGAHRGPAQARNAGLEAARGTFIAFLDGDDVWHPAQLQSHVDVLLANPAVDLAFSRSRYIDARGNPLALPVRRTEGFVSFEALLEDNVIGNGSSVVVRRSALDRLGGFDESLSACIDYDLWLRVAAAGDRKVICIPEVLTSYRRHPTQITSDWRRMEDGWRTTILKARRSSPDVVDRVERRAMTNWYRYLSYVAYEQRDLRGAVRCLVRSIRATPPAALSRMNTWLLSSAICSKALLPARVHNLMQAAIARLLPHTFR